MAMIYAGFVARTRQRGLLRTARLVTHNLVLAPLFDLFTALRTWRAPDFVGPTQKELEQIEQALAELGVEVRALAPDVAAFEEFKRSLPFPDDYHGGRTGGVYDEKRVEHFLAYTLCGLDERAKPMRYVDVAAGSSPWAQMLRDRGQDVYAIDLAIKPSFGGLDYYLQEDATATEFARESIDAMSLQCAYEMFGGESDVRLLDECSRVLKPGGVVVISPLYMHTHHCGYASPEHWGRGHADGEGVEYVRRGIKGIPYSRKYSAQTLKTRVLDRVVENGMRYELYRLTNQSQLGDNVYCHFVLVLRKPHDCSSDGGRHCL